jgi:hypothetical protein
MDDIQWVMELAKDLGRRGEGNEKPFFNSASSLHASKKNVKRAIKDRIRLLCGAYISLASFVSDDDIEAFTNDDMPQEKKNEIVQKVLDEIEKNRKEIEEFRPLENL